MKPGHIIMLGLAALVLCQCDGKKGQSIDMGEQRKAFPAPDAAMAFDVRLEFTPEAVKRLDAYGDEIGIETSYYGLPTAASMVKANRLHQIDLGEENFIVGKTARKIHLTGALDRSLLPEVVDGVAYMVIQASPGIASEDLDKRVDCNTYRGSIQQAQVPDTAVIHCDIARP